MQRLRSLQIRSFVIITTLVLTAVVFLTCAAYADSGLPSLAMKKVSKPSGAPGGLKVLDWAGMKSALTYTFDDGMTSQITNYPKLQATGVHMSFFLNLNADNVATWKQALKDGHELGNHTANHCHANGTGCVGPSYAGSLEAEYDLCIDYIRKTYGVSDVWTTASPYGDTGWDNVAKTRFFLNRGVRGGQIAANDDSDPYNLPTYVPADGATASMINADIDSSHAAGKWAIFLIHSFGGDNGYHPVKISEFISSVDHAKSAGDIWIDSMVNIGAYWAGQKALTNATTSTSGKKTTLAWTLPPHFPQGRFVRATVTGGKLKQDGKTLRWNKAGYYEVALDPGTLTITK